MSSLRSRRSTPGLSIAAVSRETGIPPSTLRFYEKELPSLFHLRKTRGGHRRYAPRDVARFEAVRRLTEEEGLHLSDVRRILSSPGEPEPLRESLETLRKVQSDQAQWLEELSSRVAALETRWEQLAGSRRRRGWFPGRKP